MSSPHLKAVIFDIGGVVVRSPLLAIADYERELGLPADYINCSLTARGRSGAWQRFERGELALRPFYAAFGHELSDVAHGNAAYRRHCDRKRLECPSLPASIAVDGRELFGRMMRLSQTWDPIVVKAIERIRAAGRHKVVALTNNFSATMDGVEPAELEFLGLTEGATPPMLRDMFDDFCDSSALGMRKPEPEFYLLACRRNGIQPHEAIFLDDLGQNLKAAKALGMETIHVPIDGSREAIGQLQTKVGIHLFCTSSTPAVTAKL